MKSAQIPFCVGLIREPTKRRPTGSRQRSGGVFLHSLGRGSAQSALKHRDLLALDHSLAGHDFGRSVIEQLQPDPCHREGFVEKARRDGCDRLCEIDHQRVERKNFDPERFGQRERFPDLGLFVNLRGGRGRAAVEAVQLILPNSKLAREMAVSRKRDKGASLAARACTTRTRPSRQAAGP